MFILLVHFLSYTKFYYIDLARTKNEAPILTRIYDLNQTLNLDSTFQLTLEHIHLTFEGKVK